MAPGNRPNLRKVPVVFPALTRSLKGPNRVTHEDLPCLC